MRAGDAEPLGAAGTDRNRLCPHFCEEGCSGVGGEGGGFCSPMWSHSNWEEENKMDAHAELQNSEAQARSCDVCLQVRGGGKGLLQEL